MKKIKYVSRLEVRCIDDANKPPSIPTEQWLVNGRIYTIHTVVCNQNGVCALIINEIKLPDEFCGFSIHRFEPIYRRSNKNKKGGIELEISQMFKSKSEKNYDPNNYSRPDKAVSGGRPFSKK